VALSVPSCRQVPARQPGKRTPLSHRYAHTHVHAPRRRPRRPGEAASWWTLAARCQARRDVLLGFYDIPQRIDQPLRTVINPLGMEVRARRGGGGCGMGGLVMEHPVACRMGGGEGPG
jgi:hypothetical protein